MRSRLRRVVILGPPLFLMLATVSVLRAVPRAVAGSLPAHGQVAACPSSGSSLATPSADADARGTWWQQRPDLDGAGSLTGWTLTIGSPGQRSMSMGLPPGSIVTGPDLGRIVATTDDGTRSTVWIVDALGRCSWALPVDDAVARRAIFAPGHDGIIVHLLDRKTRHDLGVWQFPLNGRPRVPVLPPPADDVLRGVGIERVWATDLRLSADGNRLAVQSCDPDACLTRVLDFRTQNSMTIEAEHGALIGFVGDHLITQAACVGVPCDILAWGLGTGRSATVARQAMGAAVSDGGQLVVAIREADGTASAAAVNLQTGAHRSVGPLERGVRPQDGTGTTGIETLPDAIGLIPAGGPPTILTIDLPASNREDRP